MSLIAAICTNRDPAAVHPALAALCEQTAAGEACSALLVTSGLDPAEHRRHADAAERLGARALAAPAGLSSARNRALGEAADGDVVAFIDDDAVPHDGWLGALRAHWLRAAPEVACIGGAIVPRWEKPPPRWVSERIYPSFSLFDRGAAVVDLDPRLEEDAFGANVSFRGGPLREVGGFDAARGPWRRVPLFGDESEVQLRLARRGYRVLYAGDVRVDHVIAAERLRLRAVWRRELFRGASASLAGRASPAAGAAKAAKAAAGLSVALAGGRAPLAGERFARLARESGAALGPLLRQRLRRQGWPGD